VALAVVTSMLGPKFSAHLRVIPQYALGPLGDGGMYLATGLKARLGNSPKPLTAPEVDEIIRKNEELLGRTIAAERKLAEYLRHEKTRRNICGRVLDFPCDLIPARVVAADAMPYGRTRLITGASGRAGMKVTTRRLLTDRSKALPERLATIHGTALVGRLMETGEFSARLQLITDAGFQIRARILRIINRQNRRRVTTAGRIQPLTGGINRLIEVLARGDGKGGMIVTGVQADENVRPGDWLVTRNDDALLPAQIRIGKVVEVAENAKDPHIVNLRIAPHENLDALREVYVVVPLGTPRNWKARD